MTAGAIHLATCIGVKSSPHLISHFIEHYQTLGVGGFLVVLHAEEGDPRAADIKRLLLERGVRPLRQITEFSATLKQRHIGEMVDLNCAPDSWVIHADVDELQVYPGGLVEYLDALQHRGHAFARGILIDRLAPGGELIEIQPSPDLWQQFPESWPVTRDLVRGWDRKVCVARASVPIADGGAHSVRYVRSPIWNYRLTHHRPRFGERRVEIHHFKWDATLPQRLRDKLEGSGGDLDRWHGSGFLHEYRRLDEHLRRFGRIRVED